MIPSLGTGGGFLASFREWFPVGEMVPYRWGDALEWEVWREGRGGAVPLPSSSPGG